MMEDLNLSRAEFCNANTRIAGATLKQSSGTLPTGKPASIEIRSMRFSFGTSCRLTKDSASVSALPGGNGNSNGNFNNVGNNGNWWSSTENDASNAYNRNMNYNNANVNRNNNDKTNLYSVRCVQDCFKFMPFLILFLATSLLAQQPAPMWVQDSWRFASYPSTEWHTGFARDKAKGSPSQAKFKEMEKAAQNSLSESIVVNIRGTSSIENTSKQTQSGKNHSETINKDYKQSITITSDAVLAKTQTYSYYDKESDYIYGFAAVKKKDLAEFYSAKINGLFSFAESELFLANSLADTGKKKSALNKIMAIEDSLTKVSYWEHLLQAVASGSTTASRTAEILQKTNAAKIALENATGIYLNVSGSEYVADELPAVMQEKGCNCSIAETAGEADYAITVKAILSRCSKAAYGQVYCFANAAVSVFNSKTQKNTSLKIPEAKGGWTEGDTAKATEESFKTLTENLTQQLLKEIEK